MSNLKKVLLSIGFVGIGVLIGRYIIKPQTKTKIKEVVKYVEIYKEKKEEKKNKKTTVTEVVRPDGTKETSTVIVENDVTTTESNRRSEGKTSIKTKIESGAKITLGMLALKDVDSNGQIYYGVTGYFPIVGNLSVTGLVTTEKQVGIGLALSF